jgi:hypothetical protein
LEDREFKESFLGEEWWYMEGIDNYKITYQEAIEKNIYKSPEKHGFDLIKPTVRQFLQQLGTEALRDNLHENVHVNALFSRYKESKPPKGNSYDYYHTNCCDCGKSFSGHKRQFICNDCHDTHNWYPNWIISDTRFPNELQAIKDRGGITIRINRTFTKEFDTPISKNCMTHESEIALLDSSFDYEIDNSGTIEDLIGKVREILIKEGII